MTIQNPLPLKPARYALEKKLKGIMFWELANDLPQEGLLEALVKTANSE